MPCCNVSVTIKVYMSKHKTELQLDNFAKSINRAGPLDYKPDNSAYFTYTPFPLFTYHQTLEGKRVFSVLIKKEGCL